MVLPTFSILDSRFAILEAVCNLLGEGASSVSATPVGEACKWPAPLCHSGTRPGTATGTGSGKRKPLVLPLEPETASCNDLTWHSPPYVHIHSSFIALHPHSRALLLAFAVVPSPSRSANRQSPFLAIVSLAQPPLKRRSSGKIREHCVCDVCMKRRLQ